LFPFPFSLPYFHCITVARVLQLFLFLFCNFVERMERSPRACSNKNHSHFFLSCRLLLYNLPPSATTEHMFARRVLGTTRALRRPLGEVALPLSGSALLGFLLLASLGEAVILHL
jgi:hypothetical protein